MQPVCACTPCARVRVYGFYMLGSVASGFAVSMRVSPVWPGSDWHLAAMRTVRPSSVCNMHVRALRTSM